MRLKREYESIGRQDLANLVGPVPVPQSLAGQHRFLLQPPPEEEGRFPQRLRHVPPAFPVMPFGRATPPRRQGAAPIPPPWPQEQRERSGRQADRGAPPLPPAMEKNFDPQPFAPDIIYIDDPDIVEICQTCGRVKPACECNKKSSHQ